MDSDEFGDDDLAAIPDNTLKELEEQAISSTQRPRSNHGPPAAPQRAKIQTFRTPGLTRTSTASKSAWRPPQPRQQPSQTNRRPNGFPTLPSSDYGFDDEDVIDLDEPSMVIQNTSGLPSRTSVAPEQRPRFASKAPLDPETEAAFAAADAELGAPARGQWSHQAGVSRSNANGISTDTDVSALLSRIASLEAETTRLQQSEAVARNAAQAKEGEIAIVRANHAKANKEYERRIAVMQKLHADEAAKAKAELEQGKKEREVLGTESAFLRHEVVQAREEERSKGRLMGAGRARTAGSGRDTPRKNRRATELGDGFEDNEVHMPALVSPSKSREKDRDKSREQTPKAGAKRKRLAQDSPVPVLSFAQPQPARAPEREISEAQVAVIKPTIREEDEKYSFIQRLLNHYPCEGHERSLEALMKHSLPSDSERTLSSIILDGLSIPTSTDEPLALKLAHIVLKLWDQCLKERLFLPIYLLLDLLRFALDVQPASIITKLISSAVPLFGHTIETVACPFTRASRYSNYATSAEYRDIVDNVIPHFDLDEVLDMLQIFCDAASLNEETLDQFWRLVEFTPMVVLLNKALPVSQITSALRMLKTSPLANTFGPIYAGGDEAGNEMDPGSVAEKQAKQERDTIERLTSLLFEMPEVPVDEPPYTEAEIAELRIEILEILKAVSATEHGGLLLAQHRTTIGRLVRFLDGQLCRLYNTRPSVGLAAPEFSKTTTDEEGDLRHHGETAKAHDLIAKTINLTTRLLYHLLRTHEPHIDLQQKLRAVKGGYHKFLSSMTRIAFSEQLVLEQGIDEAVVEAAHCILDNVLSPEEGEAIMKAVETPRGTKGSAKSLETTEKATSPEDDGGVDVQMDVEDGVG